MSDDDDLLNPDEIEALLKGPGGGDTEEVAETTEAVTENTPEPTEEPANSIDSNEMESLITDGGEAPDLPQPDALLAQAQAGLSAAIAPEISGIDSIPNELGSPSGFEFESFDNNSENHAPAIGLDALKEVDLDLRVELGRTELLIDEVLKLVKGSVVPLDKLAGDPVDVIVNDNLVARGEVLVLNGNFCVRIAEILSPDS